MKSWRSFGIKAILVLVFLISVPMGWIANQRSKYARCERAIQELPVAANASDGSLMPFFWLNRPKKTLLDRICGKKYSHLSIFAEARINGPRSSSTPIPIRSEDFHGISSMYIQLAPGSPSLSQFREMPDLKKLWIKIPKLQDLDLSQFRHFDQLSELRVDSEKVFMVYPGLYDEGVYDQPLVIKLHELLPETRIFMQ